MPGARISRSHGGASPTLPAATKRRCVRDAWLARWRARCASEAGGETPGALAYRADAMRRVNPIVIARNHRVEEALAAASDRGDLAPFRRLLDALCQPYVETVEFAAYAEPAPAAVTACYRTFCGT